MTTMTEPRRRSCLLCDQEPDWCIDGKDLCTGHYVEQYSPISFVYHRDVPAWAKAVFMGDQMLRNLAVLWTRSMPDVTVHVFHRSEAETLAWTNNWVRKHDPDLRRQNAEYYQRGWSHYPCREIVMLVDDTETPESVAWLFYHELTHISVDHVPYLAAMFRQEDQQAGRGGYQVGDDLAHEAHSIEQFCNRVATSYVGGTYDRLWWRKRAEAQRLEEQARAARAVVTTRDEAA